MAFRQDEFANTDSADSSADLDEDEAALAQARDLYEDVTQGMQGQVERQARQGAG